MMCGRTVSLFLIFLLLNGCGRDIQPAIDPTNNGSLADHPPSPDALSPDAPSPDNEFTLLNSEQDAKSQLAEKTVSRFMAATKATDIEALTKLTDVPFLLFGTVFEKKEELRPQFARLLEKKDLLLKLTFEIREVITFETISKKEMSGQVGEFLKRNLKEGDQIVIADILLPEKKPDRHVHYVKIRDGKARIVGLLDMPIPKKDLLERTGNRE